MGRSSCQRCEADVSPISGTGTSRPFRSRHCDSDIPLDECHRLGYICPRISPDAHSTGADTPQLSMDHRIKVQVVTTSESGVTVASHSSDAQTHRENGETRTPRCFHLSPLGRGSSPARLVNRVLTSPLLCYPSLGAAGGPAVY